MTPFRLERLGVVMEPKPGDPREAGGVFNPGGVWNGTTGDKGTALNGLFYSQSRTRLADGGRLVCVAGRGPATRATLFVRAGEAFGSRPLFDAAAPVLPAFRAEPGFVF